MAARRTFLTAPVRSARIDCDFGWLYGDVFAELREREPETVHLAERSAIAVYSKKIISQGKWLLLAA